jgi:hypothetical protein
MYKISSSAPKKKNANKNRLVQTSTVVICRMVPKPSILYAI